MLVRISGRDEEAKNTKGHSGYDDDKDIKNGDKGYVIIGKEDDIIGDEDGGKLKPNKPITKGEAEKMIDKTKPRLIPTSEIPKPTPEPTTPVPVEPTPMPVEPTPAPGKPTPIPKPDGIRMTTVIPAVALIPIQIRRCALSFPSPLIPILKLKSCLYGNTWRAFPGH